MHERGHKRGVSRNDLKRNLATKETLTTEKTPGPETNSFRFIFGTEKRERPASNR
jgi:hypothetical protein